MIAFPFLGPSNPRGALAHSCQRTVNLYPEVDPSNKSEFILMETPGYKKWTDLGNGPVRKIIEFRDHLIVVSHRSVWKVNYGGHPTFIGTLNTTTGRVGMAENGTQVIIVDGLDGWIYDNVKLTQISDSTFTDTKADSVVCNDGYFIINEPGTGRFWVSGSYDGTAWSALDTATAEFRTDNILAVGADRHVIFLGDKSAEWWYNDGSTNPPYAPLKNNRMTQGIAAPLTFVTSNNTSTWVSQNENGGVRVIRASGSSPQYISTPAWEREWSSYDVKDAYAFAITWHGHDWYVLTFPVADHGWGRTFLYDALGGWFEWGDYREEEGEYQKHPMTAHYYFDFKHVIGDADGDLHLMEEGIYTNNGTTIISERICSPIHENRRRHSYNLLEVDTEKADGGTLRMNHSDDGGRSWKKWRTTSMGSVGDTRARVRFYKLGSAYDRAYRVRISDAVPRRFLGAYLG